MTTNMDEGYRLYGATVLAQLAADMAGESAGVKAGTDIEYIHRMRVASRRLRAALPLFAGCFPKKEYKHWENEIKQITRSLGRARDLDVQIAFLREYAEKQACAALPPGTPRFLPEALHCTRPAARRTGTAAKGKAGTRPSHKTLFCRNPDRPRRTGTDPSPRKENAGHRPAVRN